MVERISSENLLNLQEIVLSTEQDTFFKNNMFKNFGDLGMNVKKMVDDFQTKSRSNQAIQSLEDMAKFLENYPEFRKMQGNVSKHVALMTEMSRMVDERKLMSVSQVEQELSSHAQAMEELNTQLGLPDVTDLDKLRLVMLYALRYEKDNSQQIQQIVNALGVTRMKHNPKLVYALLQQAGENKRTGDLFSNRDLINKARTVARGLKGVENVYTQHQPLVFQITESILKGRLKDTNYPFVGNHAQQGRPQDVVIFIVGGTTYAESRVVTLQNAANPGTRIILGGTVVHNTSSFVRDLEDVKRIGRGSIY